MICRRCGESGIKDGAAHRAVCLPLPPPVLTMDLWERMQLLIDSVIDAGEEGEVPDCIHGRAEALLIDLRQAAPPPRDDLRARLEGIASEIALHVISEATPSRRAMVAWVTDLRALLAEPAPATPSSRKE